MKIIHFIGNAHLDPVLLWDRREDLNEGIAIVRIKLDEETTRVMASWGCVGSNMFPTGIRMRLAVLLNNKRTCGAWGSPLRPHRGFHGRRSINGFSSLLTVNTRPSTQIWGGKLKSGTVLRARARGIYNIRLTGGPRGRAHAPPAAECSARLCVYTQPTYGRDIRAPLEPHRVRLMAI